MLSDERIAEITAFFSTAWAVDTRDTLGGGAISRSTEACRYGREILAHIAALRAALAAAEAERDAALALLRDAAR